MNSQNFEIDFECLYTGNGNLVLVENAKRLKVLWTDDCYQDMTWNEFLSTLKILWYNKFNSMNWNEFVYEMTKNHYSCN